MNKEVRNQVPFMLNEDLDCGPVCVMMAARHFGVEVPFQQVKALVSSESAGVVWTIGIAAALAEIGLAVRLYSKNLGLNQQNFALPYYQTFANSTISAQEKIERLSRRCSQLGGILTEQSVTLDFLCDAVREGAVPIILLDWSKVTGDKGYIGHFVPLVGFDEKNVMIHNPGPKGATPFLKMGRDVFEVARKAMGTDEDIVIVDGFRR